MYQTDALNTFIVFVIIIIASTLIFGLIAALIAFSTKSAGMEVLSWICSSLWLLFYLFLKNLNLPELSDYNVLIELSKYVIFLIFFILLLHRTNLAQGNGLKRLYIAKTVILISCISMMISQIFAAFTELQGLDGPSLQRAYLFFTIASEAVFWSLMVIFCLQYLKKIKEPILNTPILKSALIFTCCVYGFGMVFHLGLFQLKHMDLFEQGDHSSIIFDAAFFLKVLANLLIGTSLSAFIASRIYQKKENI